MYVPPASPPPAYRQPLAVFQAEMCRICTCPARVMLKVCEAEGCDRGEVTKLSPVTRNNNCIYMSYFLPCTASSAYGVAYAHPCADPLAKLSFFSSRGDSD